MTCVTCHNPHISVKETNNLKFNQACLNCHNNSSKTKNNCTEPKVKKELTSTTSSAINCVGCHMPRSGSIDIPHVTVHDHYIRKPNKLNTTEKEKIKKFIGLFAINEKQPDSLTKAKAYINQYEKFEQKPFYLDSAQKYLSIKSETEILKNLDALIQLYFLKGNYQQVVNLISKIGADKIIKNHLTKKSYTNEHAWTCYRIAESYLNLNSLNVALLFHQKAVELAPFVPDFRDKLANCYAMNGDVISAEQHFIITLKEHPKHVQALTNYGFLCLTMGNALKAEQLYLKALKLDPDFEPLLLNMAGLKNYKGDRDGAKIILNKILKKNPNNAQVKNLINRL
jgi:tetratricopeptide (TPR) repeat protein